MVTAEVDNTLLGSTVSSFNSVSLAPPLVLFSLARSALTFPLWLKATHFGVTVLAESQSDMSNRFARGGPEKWSGLAPLRSANGVPLLRDGLVTGSNARPMPFMKAETTRSWSGAFCPSREPRRRLCFSTPDAIPGFIPIARSRPSRMPTFGFMAGDAGVAGKGQGGRLLQVMPAYLGQRMLGIQDELPRDVVRHLEGFRVDVAEQRVVDQPDERRDAGDLLFAMGHQGHADASPVARARPLGQKA